MGEALRGHDSGFDVEEVLKKLNVDEKIALLSGIDFWHTASVPRLGVPSIRLSDGPNGVRGTKFFQGVPAACFPCGKFAESATYDMNKRLTDHQVPALEQHGTPSSSRKAGNSWVAKP